MISAMNVKMPCLSQCLLVAFNDFIMFVSCPDLLQWENGMYLLWDRLQNMLSPKAYQAAKALVITVGVALIGVIFTLVIGYVMASPTFGWTGVALTHPFNGYASLSHG